MEKDKKFNNFLLTPQQQKKTQILLVSFFLNFFFLIQEISLLYCRLYTLVIRICQPLLADLPLHRLRGPVRDHAPHQHLPLQRHDLLLHQDGGYREGAQHLRRLLRLRVTVRVGGTVIQNKTNQLGEYSVSRNQRCKTKSHLYLICRLFSLSIIKSDMFNVMFSIGKFFLYHIKIVLNDIVRLTG